MQFSIYLDRRVFVLSRKKYYWYSLEAYQLITSNQYPYIQFLWRNKKKKSGANSYLELCELLRVKNTKKNKLTKYHLTETSIKYVHPHCGQGIHSSCAISKVLEVCGEQCRPSSCAHARRLTWAYIIRICRKVCFHLRSHICNVKNI